MKATLFAVIFALALPVLAANGVDAKGKVLYKNKDGKLVSREVSLFVPEKGQGDVVLTAGETKVKAHAFKAVKQGNRTIFAVVFLNPPGAPEKTAAGFMGTYMRGTNLAVYYGDMYAKKYEDGRSAEVATSLLKSILHEDGQCSGQCEGQCEHQDGEQCDGQCNHEGHEGHQGHQDHGQQGDDTCDHHEHGKGATHIGGFYFSADVK